jgi:hypothetical protein
VGGYESAKRIAHNISKLAHESSQNAKDYPSHLHALELHADAHHLHDYALNEHAEENKDIFPIDEKHPEAKNRAEHYKAKNEHQENMEKHYQYANRRANKASQESFSSEKKVDHLKAHERHKEALVMAKKMGDSKRAQHHMAYTNLHKLAMDREEGNPELSKALSVFNKALAQSMGKA